MIDLVLINPGDRKIVFQELGNDLTSIEPPYQIASYAAFIRNEGYNVRIIDANAENISIDEIIIKITHLNPKLVALIVYGNQPSASTQNMSIAGKIAAAIKHQCTTKVALGGLHASALPQRTLEEESVDFVIEGEEQIPLLNILEYVHNKRELEQIHGIWYFHHNKIKNTTKPPLLKDLDKYLPIAAWDLLPMEKYKAHNWHCFDNIEHRMPYSAIYTSLGCPYKCHFCCINSPYGKSGIRYRSPELVVQEIEFLVNEYNIRNLKIIDEMFVLAEKHYMKIVDLLIEKNLNLNIWAYARVDTIKEHTLNKMKKAGFNWLALGIESANAEIRDGASKKLRIKDIQDIVSKVQKSGIRVIGNYIFGLPGDTIDTMNQTLQMAKQLNCEFANFYCAMAYPGSPLYNDAIKNNLPLPDQWTGFSQHSYDIQPLPSHKLSAKEIVQFRDNAFHEYFENDLYLNMLEHKFGVHIKEHIQEVTKIRLKRKILTT